jgi:hypothetical protein
MAGGIAVRGNLLIVTWTAARGHVFLFDLEAQQRVSAWTVPDGPRGYSDAAGVAMDDRYHVFVADAQNDRVCEFTPFGRHVRDFGDAAPATGDVVRDRPGVLDRPHAVAVRGDLVYVAGGDQPRRRAVQRWSRQGTALRPLAARGDAEASFGAPRGLWADAGGVLVADTLRGTLQEFRGDSLFLRERACGSSAAVARPHAVVRQGNGAVWFVDRGDEPGVFGFDAARGDVRMGSDDLRRYVSDAIGLALDRTDRVYVLDRLGERVVRFSPTLQFEIVVVDLAEWLDDPPQHS